MPSIEDFKRWAESGPVPAPDGELTDAFGVEDAVLLIVMSNGSVYQVHERDGCEMQLSDADMRRLGKPRSSVIEVLDRFKVTDEA
jgi:hypothetical protein